MKENPDAVIQAVKFFVDPINQGSEWEKSETTLIRKKDPIFQDVRVSNVEAHLRQICKWGSPFDDHYERAKEVGSGYFYFYFLLISVPYQCFEYW